jgi:hypothetical protein
MRSAPEISPQTPVVEVFYPSSAPHLGAIAAEIQAEQLRQLEAMTPAQLERVMELGAAITRDRNAFARFLKRIAINQPGD